MVTIKILQCSVLYVHNQVTKRGRIELILLSSPLVSSCHLCLLLLSHSPGCPWLCLETKAGEMEDGRLIWQTQLLQCWQFFILKEANMLLLSLRDRIFGLLRPLPHLLQPPFIPRQQEEFSNTFILGVDPLTTLFRCERYSLWLDEKQFQTKILSRRNSVFYFLLG